MSAWSMTERAGELARAEASAADLIVIGGGITGAGVARDAALRGLSTVLVERGDFAAGTSSQTSKMIHGGLRYLAHGHLGLTREACRERDLLARLNPNLVRPLPFLLCAFAGEFPRWKVRAGLTLYSALAGRGRGEFRMLEPAELPRYSRDLRREGLRGAGLYRDCQVDDARFVLETIADARRAGSLALNHVEATGRELDAEGRLAAVVVRDRVAGGCHVLRGRHVVNATGPNVDDVRALLAGRPGHELRPAKGVHAVIPRGRVHADAAVALRAEDGRHMFLCPFDDVHLIGTTDTFVDDASEPRVTPQDLRYVLAAANATFPAAALEERDVIGVYAGVRPLLAPADAEVPPSSVSREYRVTRDALGVWSAAGGKLTTFRALAERLVDGVVAELPAELRAGLAACATRERPLRRDAFDPAELRAEVAARFGVEATVAQRLVEAYGERAVELLERAPREALRPIAGSRYLHAEVAWAVRAECAASLCDVLERRLRVAVFVPVHGLPELDALARSAQQAAGWSDARARDEVAAYRDVVERRYRVVREGKDP